MKGLALAAALLSFFGAAATTSRPDARTIRYNEAYRVVTHNSYWVKRDNVVEAFASGTQERLLDQLLFDRARGLELDIHKDDGRPGVWSVYHTDKSSNSFCSPLSECLKQLEQFQYALPRHEVVTVVLELKEILEYNFDDTHRPRDLDAVLERYLGPNLYRPRDFLARCHAGATMRECAREKGWPTLSELRGKFIVTVLGNWRWCTVGHGGSGWATYATADGGVRARSAFPMSSDFRDLTHESCGTEYVAPDTLKSAYDASVFMQVENVSDPAHLEEVREFLSEGGIVRGHDSFAANDQQARVAAGFQLVQTDYPWLQYNDQGFDRPLRAFERGQGISEPGLRLAFLRTGAGSGFAFASVAVGRRTSEWETLPATTRPSPDSKYPNPRWARGKGCLRAASRSSSFAVCRQTVDGHWNVRKPLGEDIAITVEITRGGRPSLNTFYSSANTTRGAGDQLRLTTHPYGHQGVCATAWTATEIASNGFPAWKRLVTQCFDEPLPSQGLSAQWGDVVFTGTRHDSAAASLVASTPSLQGTGYEVRDLSFPRGQR